MLGANHLEGDVHPMNPRPRCPLAAALLIGAVVLIASCAANPVTGRQDFMLISESEEVEMGRKVDASVTREYGLYNDARLTDYVVPTGVRIGDASRVRLGAYLSPGTTVMHEGFVNYNAGTLGQSMVEGRISQGVIVGDGSDIGGRGGGMWIGGRGLFGGGFGGGHAGGGFGGGGFGGGGAGSKW